MDSFDKDFIQAIMSELQQISFQFKMLDHYYDPNFQPNYDPTPITVIHLAI